MMLTTKYASVSRYEMLLEMKMACPTGCSNEVGTQCREGSSKTHKRESCMAKSALPNTGRSNKINLRLTSTSYKTS